MGTSVEQAMRAIQTYVEGQTGVRYSLPVFNRDELKKSVFFTKEDSNVLNIFFEKIPMSDNGRNVNPFSMVMSWISLSLSLDVKDFSNNKNAEKMRSNPLDWTNELYLDRSDGQTKEAYVTVNFRWGHKGHGENGDSVYFLFQNGNIFKVYK